MPKFSSLLQDVRHKADDNFLNAVLAPLFSRGWKLEYRRRMTTFSSPHTWTLSKGNIRCAITLQGNRLMLDRRPVESMSEIIRELDRKLAAYQRASNVAGARKKPAAPATAPVPA